MGARPLPPDAKEFLVTCFEEGMTSTQALGKFQEVAHRKDWHIPARKTVERYRNAWVVAARYSRQNEREAPQWDAFQLAGGTQRFLEEMRTLLEARARRLTRKCRTGVSTHHLRRLYELVDAIRTCLYNPQLKVRESIGDPVPLLAVNGKDWSLSPGIWLSLTTPDFSEPALWGDLFPALKEHMAESPFWEHLEELERKADELEAIHNEAASKLAERDKQFEVVWEKVRREGVWRKERVSRTPHTSEIPGDINPWYGAGLAQKVLGAFEDLGYEVHKRHRELVVLLEQLHSDLLPDRIEPLIAEGGCEFCR